MAIRGVIANTRGTAINVANPANSIRVQFLITQSADTLPINNVSPGIVDAVLADILRGAFLTSINAALLASTIFK